MNIKILSASALPNWRLFIRFSNGKFKLVPISTWFGFYKSLNKLKKDNKFYSFKIDQDGEHIIWDDENELNIGDLLQNGLDVTTCFSGMLSFKEAAELWNIDESTLRKAVAHRKFIEGIDVCKFGKQWVVTIAAMEREYGEIKFPNNEKLNN